MKGIVILMLLLPVARSASGQDAPSAQAPAQAPSEHSYFGTAIATDGATTLVGAPFESTPDVEAGGAVFVYRRSGAWEDAGLILPHDPSPDDHFGQAVAVAGTWALVGAPGDHTHGLHGGSAYLFHREDGAWSMHAKLHPDPSSSGSRFGASAALDGDVALIGAPMPGSGSAQAGSVYVYRMENGEWTLEDRLTAPGSEDRPIHFGSSVALDGDVAVIGAPFGDGQVTGAGAAYVFERTDGGWTWTTTLTASDGVANAFFGQSVSIDDGRVGVGAYMHPDESGGPAGAAYVFSRDNDGWREEARLTASGALLNDFFAASVAIHGTTAAIGSARRDDAARVDAGAVYVFRRSAEGVWMQDEVIVPPDLEAYDLFGSAVVLDGSDLIAGAPLKDLPNFDGGAVYFVTLGDGTGTSTEAPVLPASFAVGAFYPNPFHRTTTLSLDLPAITPVDAEVYDAVGRRVAVLINDRMPAGTHQLHWDAGDQPAGVYFVRIHAGPTTRTLQAVLVR